MNKAKKVDKELFYLMRNITREADRSGHDCVSISISMWDKLSLSVRDIKKFEKYWVKKGWINQKNIINDGSSFQFVMRKEVEKRLYFDLIKEEGEGDIDE